jgi:hypothetical protein
MFQTIAESISPEGILVVLFTCLLYMNHELFRAAATFSEIFDVRRRWQLVMVPGCLQL